MADHLFDPLDRLPLDPTALAAFDAAEAERLRCGVELYRWPLMHAAMLVHGLTPIPWGDVQLSLTGSITEGALMDMTLYPRGREDDSHILMRELVLRHLVAEGWLARIYTPSRGTTANIYQMTQLGLEKYHEHFATAPA